MFQKENGYSTSSWADWMDKCEPLCVCLGWCARFHYEQSWEDVPLHQRNFSIMQHKLKRQQFANESHFILSCFCKRFTLWNIFRGAHFNTEEVSVTTTDTWSVTKVPHAPKSLKCFKCKQLLISNKWAVTWECKERNSESLNLSSSVYMNSEEHVCCYWAPKSAPWFQSVKMTQLAPWHINCSNFEISWFWPELLLGNVWLEKKTCEYSAGLWQY